MTPEQEKRNRYIKRQRMLRKRQRNRMIAYLCGVILLLVFLSAGIGKLLSSRQTRSVSGENTGTSSVRSPEGERVSFTTVQKQEGKYLICIDPGHGGTDPGAGDDIYEKDVNLAIGLLTREMLEDAGYQVIMTRETDDYVSLEDRVAFANTNHVDLYISVHQNSLEDDTVTNGVETYYTQGDENSAALASLIQDNIANQTGAKNRGTSCDMSLYVNANTTAPSVLIECGFMTAEEEGGKLLDASYQRKIAFGILAGVNQYFNQ